MKVNEPKYKQVVDYIREKVATGALKDKDKVPSENALTKRFSVSRDTVRRAFSKLEEEGLLVSIRGSGTFIHIKKKSSSNRIAVITTYVENYIFPKIITGIEAALSEEGFVMQLSFTNNQFEREREVLENILNNEDVAGIIMEPVKSALPNPNLSCYRMLDEKGIPVLFINSYYRELNIPHVSLNDSRMGYLATKYLISKGHERIGAILKMDDGQGHLRFSGFSQALYEIGEKKASELVVWYDTRDEKNPSNLIGQLEERLKDCTAVFCYNDKAAKNFAGYLAKKGLEVPKDISIISMDDSDIARYGDVKLTSITLPSEELGRVAAKNLLGLIKDPKFVATKEFITDVHERESVMSIEKERQ